MTDRDLARRAILESAILKELDALNADTRGALAESGMQPGDRVTVGDLGYVQVTNPRPSRRVVDWAALTRWVEQHAPDQIITTTQISPSFIKAVVASGEYTSPTTGEVLEPDGVGTVPGTPQLRVVPTGVAQEAARALLGALPLAIEPGTARPESEGTDPWAQSGESLLDQGAGS